MKLAGMLLGFALVGIAGAQAPVDSDHDGLSDAVEQGLLEQFAPSFMVGVADCSNIPAEFEAGVKTPTVVREDGTIYGQVFPLAGGAAELHFYHLWRRDCGGHGHPLDTEHVAVRVHPAGEGWKADLWYAAAHENTVCDVSQIARASALGAEDQGAKVWISPGKHASYLNAELCLRGCGADRCDAMKPLKVAKIINLGELGAPMNGSVFASSSAWPLEAKMKASNFPAVAVARVEGAPANDIVWFNPGRHPAQGIIAISGATEGKLANSGAETSAALGTAQDQTGSALGTGYRKTRGALGSAVRHVGKALGAKDEQPKVEEPK